jgi:hypothetical protein
LASIICLNFADSGLSGSTEILYRKPESVADVENKVNDAESMIPPKETNGQGGQQRCLPD